MTRPRSEASIAQQRAYGRAYYKALSRLARAHPDEFSRIFEQVRDDEQKTAARRVDLDTYAVRRRT